MCSTARIFAQTTTVVRLTGAPFRAARALSALVLCLNTRSPETPHNLLKINYLAEVWLLPMRGLGTKCKNPPPPRSTIRINQAVCLRNAHAPSHTLRRRLWVGTFRHPHFGHFPLRKKRTAPQTTQRSRRRERETVHPIAARRRRTPNKDCCHGSAHGAPSRSGRRS